MKNILKRTLATFLVVLMTLTAAPLQGFVGMEWDWLKIDLPEINIENPFAVKAEAKTKLTAEEAVDIYMSKKSTWLYNKFPFNTSYAEYFFIDLDFDDILELVVGYTVGSNNGGEYTFYKIIPSNKTVMYVGTCNFDLNFFRAKNLIGVDFLQQALHLFENKNTFRKFYIGGDYIHSGSDYDAAILKKLELKNGTLIENNISQAYTNSPFNPTEDSKKYYLYDSGLHQVSRTSYLDYLYNFKYTDNKDLNLKIKPVVAGNFETCSFSKQRQLLLESYKAFSYDGLGGPEFTKDEYEMYLGYTPQKGNTSQNCAWLTFKGDLDNFKLSDVKVVVENEKIAKVKELTSQQLLENSIDLFAYIDTKKIGETKITVKYKDEVMDESLIKVIDPNELKLEIEEPNYTYYETDRVFFDDSGFIARGGIKLKMKYSNAFIEGVNFPVTNPEKQELLKIKNAKIVFTLEEGAGLSFDNTETKTAKEFPIKELAFLEEVEDVLQVFCTDSNALGQTESITAKIKYSIMMPNNPEKPLEDSEDKDFTEKATDSMEFDVKSYKRHYVNEHLASLKPGGKYHKMLPTSYASRMKGLEDTKDFKFTQFLNDSLVQSIIDEAGELDEQQAYLIVLGDLVSALNMSSTESINEVYGEKLCAFASFILDFLSSSIAREGFSNSCFWKLTLKYDYDELLEGFSKLTVDDVLLHFLGDVKNPYLGDLDISETLYKQAFSKIGCSMSTLNKICTYGGFVIDAVSDISSVMHCASAITTIFDLYEEQLDVLVDLRNTAYSCGENAFAKALTVYIDAYENQSIPDDLIKKITASKIVDNGVSIVTTLCSEGLSTMIRNTLQNAWGNVFFALGEGVAAVLSGFDLGRFVSDMLCNNSDYGAACLQLVLAGHMAETVREQIYDYYGEMCLNSYTDLETAFKYAQKLDCALNMFKHFEIMACDSTVEALNARKTSAVIQTFCKSKEKDYNEMISDARVRKIELSGRYCHDTCLANIYAKITGFEEVDFEFNTALSDQREVTYKTICVQCPVDVFVKNSKGQNVASVENNVVTNSADNVSIVVVGDEKYITLPADDEYDVDIVATDEGTMNYTVFEYSKESSSSARSVKYENIPLVANKQFSTTVNDDLYTDKNNYNLSTGNETVTATSDNFVELTALNLDSYNNAEIYTESTLEMVPAVTPANASASSFNWSSSDESVATVSGGTVKAIKAGTVTITCTAKNDSTITDSVTLTVKDCAHSYGEFETVKDSTCSEYGLKNRRCGACGKVDVQYITDLKQHVTDENGSAYTREATCMSNAYTFSLCVNCGAECNKTEISDTKISHCFTNYVSDNNATYAADGTKTAYCDYYCGNKDTVTDTGTKLLLGVAKTSGFTATITSVTVNWEEVTDATGYRLFLHNGSNWEARNDTSALTYTVSGLKSNTKYKIAVRAYVEIDGEKILSPKYLTIYTATQPSSVTKITATPKAASAALSWTKISGVDGYRVFRYNSDTKKWITLTDTSSLKYTAKDLKANTKYRFAVRVYYILNGEKVLANKYADVYATTLIGKTSSLKATPTSNSVKLTWSAVSGATGYRVYQYDYNKKASDKLTDTTSKSYTVKNLKPGKRYRFSVKAYKTVDGKKQWSDIYTIVVTATLPNNVTSLKTVAITTSTTKLSWNKASGATHYRVFVKNGSKWKKLKDVTGTTYTVTKMKSGTKYTFAVRAFAKIEGEEVMSAKYPTLHTASKPTTPSISKITVSSGKARLYWSAVSGETGYTVYYSTKKDSGFKKYANYKADSTNGYVSGLTKGKSYYFKVRTYIKTDSGYVYSAWSSIKGIKIK